MPRSWRPSVRGARPERQPQPVRGQQGSRHGPPLSQVGQDEAGAGSFFHQLLHLITPEVDRGRSRPTGALAEQVLDRPGEAADPVAIGGVAGIPERYPLGFDAEGQAVEPLRVRHLVGG
ncbi:MAG: phage DNA packaging protein J [Candidatus Dormibacteraeota bacterium]|nr:phage DNA packaging protein J [Candidatus Dormibacteraeota bacterium]